MRNITNKEWRELLEKDDNAVILDVRTPMEWDEGVIDENALLINVLDTPFFLKKAQELDKNKNYYLYCRSGNRSAQAAYLLESYGVKTTYNLMYGIMGWDGKIVAPKLKNKIA
jgi:rhodanese-related sulfurtransferase